MQKEGNSGKNKCLKQVENYLLPGGYDNLSLDLRATLLCDLAQENCH